MISKNILYYTILILFFGQFLIACSDDSTVTPEPEKVVDETPTGLDPFEQNKLLGKGVNFGNALEAPNEGDHGLTLESGYFKLITDAGFNSIRVPIKWSSHALQEAPYTIDSKFFERIDWVISNAKLNGLAAILNIHHYDELFEQPAAHKDRFLAIWKQIAERYKYEPKEIFFEILNEPHANLTAELWNQYLVEALNIIRVSNPGRTILIGTADWGGVGSLSKLKIPITEQNVIVTFHYYNPFQFTHQGAEWVDNSMDWMGTKWEGNAQEKQVMTQEFDAVQQWSIDNNRPINMGEFGSFSTAEEASRVRWTNYVANGQATPREFSWNYWEFGAGFGIYDINSNQWRRDLLKALLPNTP